MVACVWPKTAHMVISFSTLRSRLPFDKRMLASAGLRAPPNLPIYSAAAGDVYSHKRMLCW
jgi:hypothetical protein